MLRWGKGIAVFARDISINQSQNKKPRGYCIAWFFNTENGLLLHIEHDERIVLIEKFTQIREILLAECRVLLRGPN